MKNFVLSIKESLLKAVPLSENIDGKHHKYQLAKTQFIIDGKAKTVTEVIFPRPLFVKANMESSIPELSVYLKYQRLLKAGKVASAAALNTPKEFALSRLHEFIDRFDLTVLRGTSKRALDGKSQVVSIFRDGNKSLLLIQSANNFLNSYFFCNTDNECKLIANNDSFDLSLLEKVKAQLS